MKKVVNAVRNFWKDESAQGATEYIVLLVVIVILVVAFKGKITGLLNGEMTKVGEGMDKINAE